MSRLQEVRDRGGVGGVTRPRTVPMTHELEPKERVQDPLIELLAITLYVQTPLAAGEGESSRITPDSVPWTRIGRPAREYYRRKARGEEPLIDGKWQHLDGCYR